MLHFETVKHARSLQEVLLSTGRNAEEELDAVLGLNFHLSPKDHWENNGILKDIFAWSQHGRDQLLWIGGRSGNQESWVTELSADIVQAMQPQLVSLLYVFCNQPNSERLTAIGLLRRLLVQLLDLHPRLAYRQPELCNTWRFQRAVTFSQLWRIFEQLAASIPSLFIIIDRVEECQVDEQADLSHHLLPSLIGFANTWKEVSIIVTSFYDPPEKVLDLPFCKAYIDTSKKSKWR